MTQSTPPRKRRLHPLLWLGVGVIAILGVIAVASLTGDDAPQEEAAVAPSPTAPPLEASPTEPVSPEPATPTATAEATATATPGMVEEVTATLPPAPTEVVQAPVATATAEPEPDVPPVAADVPPQAAAVQVNCGTPLQQLIDTHPEGSRLDLTGCTFTTGATVHKPLTLIGGRLTASTGSPWTPVVSISSDHVRLQGWTFEGGGTVVSVLGSSNVAIAGNSFDGQTGSAIALWGDGRGAHNVVIEGNTIVQTRTVNVSPIIARASENACSVYSRNLTILSNFVDQGQGGRGWFGIELKCQDGVHIEGNTVRGGSTLISLPDSNNVRVVGNTLDLRGSPYWGVEVPKANNVHIEGNSFVGDGPQGGDHAVSVNSGSINTIVINNDIREVRTALDTTGSHITFTGNCLTNVQQHFEYEQPPFKARRVEDNEACS